VIVPWDENLKLGKGAAFVKRDLRCLPLTDAEFEADFWLDPTMSTRLRDRWVGAVFEREFGALLAIEDVDWPPTVNDLATMLAHAMSRPFNEGDRQRPRTIYLRGRPQWQELLPHLHELGIEVVTDEELPTFNEAVVEWIQRETPSGEHPSKDKIIEDLRRPFPARKRTWHDDVLDLVKWTDEMFKRAYPSRKAPVPSYDPMTLVAIRLTPDELEAILTKTRIAKTKKLRPRLEAMGAEDKAIELDINEWSRVIVALCGPTVEKESVRKALLRLARRLANQLAEALGIDDPAGGK
jgi:hypothetical protein